MSQLKDILTPMELKRARLVADGYSNRYIAELTKVSKSYVRQRMKLIYEKIGLGISADWRISNLEPRIVLAVRYDREHR